MQITTKYEIGQSVLIISENEVKSVSIVGIQIKVSKISDEVSATLIKYEFPFHSLRNESDVYANFRRLQTNLIHRPMNKNKERFMESAFPNVVNKLKDFDLRATLAVINNSFVCVENTEKSVYLHGIVGTGKTVDLCRRCLEWAQNRYSKGFFKIDFEIITFQDLLQEIKNTYDKNAKYTEQQVIDKYRKCSLLAIDDVGMVKNSDWILTTFYSIINYRYAHLKTTYYTSNFDLNQLSQCLADERITRRIDHDCDNEIIEFTKVRL